MQSHHMLPQLNQQGPCEPAKSLLQQERLLQLQGPGQPPRSQEWPRSLLCSPGALLAQLLELLQGAPWEAAKRHH